MVDTTFIDELASAAPTPGGGGAAAYCGALASSLASMVGNLTVGKVKYAEVEPQVKEALQELAELRQELIGLIDEDAVAFSALAKTWKMPKETEEEKAAYLEAQATAVMGACQVPLQIMAASAKVIVLCAFMARNGSRLVISDAATGAVCARAAMEGASLAVIINIPSIADEQAAQEIERTRVQLLEEYTQLAQNTYEYVVGELR